MSQFPKITLVTPNYNLGDYLEQTILSVIGQNYPNLEYIIIDGGSTDNSIEIIKKYEKWLFYWVSEPDGGLYDAVQKGFERGTGEVMGWLNSDDMLHPYSLFYIAEVMLQFPEIEWLQGCPTAFDKNGGIFRVETPRRWSKYHFYIGKYRWIQQESTFWRKSLWDKAGSTLRTDLRLAGDFELWLRFFSHAPLFSTTVLLGGFRRRGKEQLSESLMQQYLEEVDEALAVQLATFSIGEKVKIFFFKMLYLFVRFISKTGIFNGSGLELRRLPTIFGAAPLLDYDPLVGRFFKR